jgi:hypothetical protein
MTKLLIAACFAGLVAGCVTDGSYAQAGGHGRSRTPLRGSRRSRLRIRYIQNVRRTTTGRFSVATASSVQTSPDKVRENRLVFVVQPDVDRKIPAHAGDPVRPASAALAGSGHPREAGKERGAGQRPPVLCVIPAWAGELRGLAGSHNAREPSGDRRRAKIRPEAACVRRLRSRSSRSSG